MQDPRESPEAFSRWVDTRDIWHRDFWIASTSHYRSIGLYKSMADFAQITSDYRWLNLGCGFCDLEITVLKDAKPRVISIDNNPYMLMEAKERLQQNGYDVSLSEDNKIRIIGDQESYVREPKRKENFEIYDNKVNVLLDDIRNLSIKKDIRRTIDVVTYSLSGVSRAGVAQWPLKLDFIPGDYMKMLPSEVDRIVEASMEVQAHVFRTAAQVLKPGGRLIYIDRFELDANPYAQISSLDIPKSLKKARENSTVIKEPTGTGAAVVFTKVGRREYTKVGFIEFRYQPKQQKKKKRR